MITAPLIEVPIVKHPPDPCAIVCFHALRKYEDRLVQVYLLALPYPETSMRGAQVHHRPAAVHHFSYRPFTAPAPAPHPAPSDSDSCDSDSCDSDDSLSAL